MKYVVINKQTGEQVDELGSRLMLNPFSGRLYDCGMNVTHLYELIPVTDEDIDDSIKDKVVAKLRKSKYERIIFSVVWDETIGKSRKTAIILPWPFVLGGCEHKRLRSLAVKRLVEKGLIFRSECDAHYEQHRCTRYSVILDACKQFIEC